MDVDKLEAGRELDEMVAEKVMEWKRLSLRENNGFAIPEHQRQRWMIPVSGAVTFDMPRWSDDIALAWEVLEKIASKAEGWVRLRERVKRGGVFWECDFGDYGEAARGPTVSLAICLAALKTMGVGNQDNYLVVKW